MQIEVRMARLERRCRLLSVGLTMSLCVLGVFIFMGAAQVDDSTVRARRVEIVDPQGNVRILLGDVEDHNYGVLVYGHERQAKCMLMAGSVAGEPVAMIRASAGQSWQGISLVAQKDSLFATIQDSKASRAAMLVHEGKAQLQLMDQNQHLVFIAPPGTEPLLKGRK